MREKIKKAIKGNAYIYENLKDIKFYFNKILISDSSYIKRTFKKRLNRELSLENPIMYNDKLQWLKLNWRNELAPICVDKYAVRSHIKNEIGGEYLNELIGVYANVEDIPYEELPSKFVIKGTHGSGFNIICTDKEKLNWSKETKKIKHWLRRDYFWSSREWVYKDLPRRIIIEKFLETPEGDIPKDYKIFCFNGEPHFIEVDSDRFSNHKRNFFDISWRPLDVEIQYPSEKKFTLPKPPTLDKMLDLSRILSKPFPHVRVDFYNIGDRIIFGELTFFHESGFGKFSSSKVEEEWGSLIDINDKKK